MANSAIAQRRRRVLPVVGWLQVGVAAAGLGLALASAPAAGADAGRASAGNDSISSASRGPANDAGTQRRGTSAARPASAGTGRPAVTRTAGPVAAVRAARTPSVRPSAAVSPTPTVAPTATVASAADSLAPALSRRAAPTPAAAGDRAVPRAAVTAQATSPVADLVGGVAAFFGLPGAPATSAPTIGALPLFGRLVFDDVFGGSAPPPTVTPSTIITGLFNEILRKDPTAAELQNYTAVWGLTGINGVVAGLYSSTEFRRTQVNSYYLELLGRPATQSELSWGTTQLIWGVPEPLFNASIAGSREYYSSSNAGGGPNGPSPSAVSFVDLLYRTLVGATPDPVVAPDYFQQVQAGLPTGLVAGQFVMADPFRQVKVLETFQVLGLSPTPVVVSNYVDNWFWYGGLAGISTLLLASGENAVRIQQGQVQLPDLVAAGQLQQLLLAPYSDGPEGFYALFNQFFDNPTTDVNCKKTPDDCANPGLYALLTTGGVARGIPNGAISVEQMAVPVARLIPNQNEISLASSLGFPLGRDPESLRVYFEGGNVTVARQLVLTSAEGQYVVDGHHRWSQLFLINPFASILAADVGYVPEPTDALVATQVAIAAQTGFLGSSSAGNDNLFTISQTDFNSQVTAIIDNGSYPDGSPLAGQPTKPAVLDVFTEFLGLAGQTDAEKMDSIENYLWSNVVRMRENNFYITDAPGRPVMPQTSRSTFQPVLGLMQGPSPLSYSFPIISYLG